MIRETGQRTRAFRLYEEGKDYNNALVPSYYQLVDTNTEFFIGNQWVNLKQSPEMQQLPKPVFNIIKRITGVLVAQITSGGLSVNLEPLSYYDGGEGDTALPGEESATVEAASGESPGLQAGFNTTEFAQAEVNNLLEKLKLEYRIRQALFDGAQTGDYCAHFYWNPNARPHGRAGAGYRGEICMELVDGVNVMFGNPNTPEVEMQPYILLIGRDTVRNLRQEYLQQHPGDEAGAQAIRADRDWNEQAAAGGKLELSGDENAKCLYLYLYERVMTEAGDPSIVVTKCTRCATIFESAETGLSRYPIAWGNWERQKNCYHGRALVTGILPNQIFINSMYAMVMRHLYLESFPKTIYNADLVPRWTNEIGSCVAIHGLQPGEGVDQVATILKPADMSGQILGTISNVEALTRECLGVTDVQMGTERADNTSAIMVVQQNAEVPLDNIRSGLYEWIEDIVKILLDMMSTYYGTRPIVRNRTMDVVSRDSSGGLPLMDPATGMLKTTRVCRRVLETFDFSRLQDVWLNVRVDVGSSTAYSEIAMTQTLDNLREAGLLNAEDYLERIPDKLVPMKQDLIDKLRKTQTQAEGVAAGQALPTPQQRSDQMIPTGKEVMNSVPDGGASDSAAPGAGKQRTGQRNQSKKKTVTGYLFDRAVDAAKLTSTMQGTMQTTFAGLPTATRNTLAKHAAGRI